MDCIYLSNIRCYGYTGFLPEEQILGQWFEVDVTLWLDLSQAGKTDALQDTLDYRNAIATVQQLVQVAKYALVERLAEAIATSLLELHRVEQVKVKVSKISPPIPDFSGNIAVEITRIKQP